MTLSGGADSTHGDSVIRQDLPVSARQPWGESSASNSDTVPRYSWKGALYSGCTKAVSPTADFGWSDIRAGYSLNPGRAGRWSFQLRRWGGVRQLPDDVRGSCHRNIYECERCRFYLRCRFRRDLISTAREVSWIFDGAHGSKAMLRPGHEAGAENIQAGLFSNTSLEPLDDTSLEFNPGIRVMISRAICWTFRTRFPHELTMSSSRWMRMPPGFRDRSAEYSYTNMRMALMIRPASMIRLAFGVQSTDRADQFEGYYDYRGHRRFPIDDPQALTSSSSGSTRHKEI